MAPRTDARQCARVICALAVVLAVYSLTVGRPGGGATVHYSVLTQHDASDKKYNAKDADSVLADNDSNKAIKSTLKLHCSPLKDKTLSSAISSSDKGYVHMIPRPKIITFKDGVAQQVLSFGSSVLMSIEHVNVSTDPALDMTFLLDRLCSMSHTFDSSADNPAVVNGSSIEYLHRVRAVMLSPEAFTVCCTNSEVPLGALDEAYSINISGGVALVYTPGSRGLRSALASIAQLLENAAPLPPSLTVLDWPSYRWRGLMLDTARHFIPVRKIYRALDAMFAVKLNYLHIHLTDSQSFPLLLEDTDDLPLSQLAHRGAFLPDEVYRLSELSDMVAYASKLGIEVVPEIDIPAHTKSWDLGFPGIVASCPRAEARGNGASKTDIPSLDISNPKVIKIIENILNQLAGVFTSQYMHVGGDEIHTECWDESPGMIALKSQNNSSWSQLLKKFEGQVFDIVNALGRTPIVWQGLQDMKSIPSATEMKTSLGRVIVQPWKCWGGLSQLATSDATTAGREVLVSACMYLDWDIEWDALLSSDSLKSSVRVARPLRLGSGSQRRVLLEERGLASTLMLFSVATSEAARRKLDTNVGTDIASTAMSSPVLGGDAPLWSERVDFSNMECRLWPRAAATAAVFWGFPSEELSNEGSYAYSLKANSRFPMSLPNSSEWSYVLHKYYDAVRGRLRWLQSYVFIQAFLSNIVRVNAAEVYVHRSQSDSCLHRNPAISSLEPAIYIDASALFADINAEVSCAEGNRTPIDIPAVTSQCQMLPLHMLIPIVAAPAPVNAETSFQNRLRGGAPTIDIGTADDTVNINLKLTSLNIENGGYAGNRIDLVQNWLSSRALYGDMIIGLIELNKWQNLRSKENKKENLQDIVFRGAESGFTFSHITSSAAHPYSIGILSVLPFKVVAEYGPPHLLRLMLHVYFDMLDLHVVVLHLTPHSSIARRKETLFVQRVLRPWMVAGARMILMGDLNTLSPADHCALYGLDCSQNQSNMNLTFIDTIQKKTHPAYVRLQEKYCSLSDAGRLQIDYTPFNIILNSSFIETCDLMCRQSTDIAKLSDVGDGAYVACIIQSCGHTEPTQYNPEWPLAELQISAPKLKVDNIFISQSIASLLRAASNNSAGDFYNITSMVLRGPITDILSDHYPVHVEFALPSSTRFWRRKLSSCTRIFDEIIELI